MSQHEAQLSAAAAARATGVARSTIQRKLKTGDFPGACETAQGWRIPVSDLLRAGYQLDTQPGGHPATGEHAQAVSHGQSHPDNETPREHAHTHTLMQRLEAELRQARHALDMERVRREAAERLAAERDRTIELLARKALPETPSKTLSAGDVDTDTDTLSETLSAGDTDTPSVRPSRQPSPTTSRRRIRRWLNRF